MSKYPDNLHEHVPRDPTSESAKPDALVSAIHGWLGWIANRARPWTKEDEDSLADLLQRAEEALAALPAQTADARDAELLALKMADRLCKEALPKFNWGASALDANAIKLLNEVPGLISAAIQREVK